MAMSLGWTRLARAGLWMGLLASVGGVVPEAWADTCRAPSLLTDGASSVPNEQRFCTGPWVYRAQKDYPCNPAVGPQCQGGVLYLSEAVPNTCRDKAFGGETFRQEYYGTDIHGYEWWREDCSYPWGCDYQGGTIYESEYTSCGPFNNDTLAWVLPGLAEYQDPAKPITYTFNESGIDYGTCHTRPDSGECPFWWSCSVTFHNIVVDWKAGTSASICGTTDVVNPRKPVLAEGNRYSPAMLTLGALKQLVPAAEIRDASLIDYGPPRCTTRDELPDGTAAQAQAKYTALKDELSSAAVASAVAGGYDEGTFKHIITGAMKRLYELRGHLLTEAQRLEIEAHYRTYPEFEKAMERVDPAVGFWWYLHAPDAKLRPDHFSVRWTGTLRPRYSETYTFRTETDDHVRLWVGDTLVLDTHGASLPFQSLPGPSGSRTALVHSGSIALSATQAYPIKIELEEWTGQSGAVVLWQSASQPLEVIPSSQVSSPADSVPTGEVAGFLGEYFDNRDFTSGVVCGNRWTPPRLPAACAGLAAVQSVKPNLDLNLGLCQRLSLDHTSASLASAKRSFCLALAADIGVLFRQCGEEAALPYEIEYNSILMGIDRKDLAAAVASSKTSMLGGDTYRAHQAKLKAWRDTVSKHFYQGREPGVRFQQAYLRALEELEQTPHVPVAKDR